MNIEGIIITPLSIMDTDGGDVLHAMKSTDLGYSGFGEAYFSIVKPGAIKGWKRHRLMISNLIVPVGTVRFVIYDDRIDSESIGLFQEVIMSIDNYSRLTVPPMVWLGFQGVNSEDSILLNISNIPHDPNEMDKKDLNNIDFNWS